MKIIHCADLHIDSSMESNFTKEQAKERKEEVLQAYERMVAYAKDNNVKVIILAGDIFDKSRIGKRAKDRFLEQILLNPEIDFIYLRGNHDNVDIFEGVDKKPDNLKLFSGKEWTKYEYSDNVVIAGIELNKDNNQTIYNQLILKNSDVNIVTLHGQESKYNNDKTEIVNLTALKNHYIDYLALGHIHQYRRERLDERGIWCYSGCLEGRGFDECGTKGFVLLDVSDGKIIDQFIPFSKREFLEVEIDISGISGILATNEIIAKVRKEVSNIESKNIVKFILTGGVDIDLDVDKDRIKEAIEDEFYFVKVYDRTFIKIDYNGYANDLSLKGEFVRIMQNEDLDEETRLRIIELGLKALTRKEIDV